MKNSIRIGFTIIVLLLSVVVSNTKAQQTHLITFNGQKLFLSGANIAWLHFAKDVGPGKTDFNQFRKLFSTVEKHGGNAMRFWVHIDGTNTPVWKGNSVVGPGKGTIKDMKKILHIAWNHHIGLLLSLWSFDMLRKKHSPKVLERNYKLLTDTTYTRKYINNSLIPMVKALKGNPAIIGWEVFNEPEGMSDEYGWKFNKHVPMKDILRFVNWVAGAIHRIDPHAKVTNGTWSMIALTNHTPPHMVTKTQHAKTTHNYYSDKSLIAAGGDPLGTLDFYTVHYYKWMGSALSPFTHNYSYWDLKKPLVVAEFFLPDSINGKVPYQNAYEDLYKRGYAGALVWQYYDWWRNRDHLGHNWIRGLENMETMKKKYPSKVDLKK